MKILVALLLLMIVSMSHSNECVILLHGLARLSSSLNELGDSLTNAGFKIENVDYESLKHPIDTLAEMVIPPKIRKLKNEGCTKIHFVTHSMGGILVRNYLSKHVIENMGRVVMLGPPNNGSEVVDNLKGWSFFQLLNGPAGNELGTDINSIPNRFGPVNFELGVIAGDRSINWINSMMIDGKDDGKVSVKSTKVKGIKDHITIHATHPLMMKNLITPIKQQTNIL